jgi:hypothetical protein
MAILGEVKYKVLQAVLILEQFTVRQVVQATDLRLESVESVIQRLQRDGYITVKGTVDDETGKQKGRPPVLYLLVEDRDKREKLFDMVDAFALEQEKSHPYFAENLRSSHFTAAVSLIRSLERKELIPTTDVLEEIENHLSKIAGDQAVEDVSPDIIKAHTDHQRGRMAYLMKDYMQAEDFFTEASNAFEANGLVQMARKCRAARAVATLVDSKATTENRRQQELLAELQYELRTGNLPEHYIQDLCEALIGWQKSAPRVGLKPPSTVVYIKTVSASLLSHAWLAKKNLEVYTSSLVIDPSAEEPEGLNNLPLGIDAISKGTVFRIGLNRLENAVVNYASYTGSTYPSEPMTEYHDEMLSWYCQEKPRGLGFLPSGGHLERTR